MSRRRPTGLSEDDRALWERVARTVRPLRSAAPPVSDAIDNAAAKGDGSRPPDVPDSKGSPAAATRSASPPPHRLDRRIMRGIARGGIKVEAVLDLHGLRQEEAYARLLGFLRGASARGRRMVMVITGKGREIPAADGWAPDRRGVLRRAVPQWLATPPFRDLVVGWERAHGRRGGDGAIYVRLRRSAGRS